MINKYLGILVFVGLAVVSVVLLSGSGADISKEDSSKLKATASFYPLYFFASEIGVDKVQVKNITPAGEEPHEYEPTPRDIVDIENSRIVILNGEIEPWADNVVGNLKSKNTLVVTISKELMTETMIHQEGGKAEEELDPHVWLNPMLSAKMVDNIMNGFIEVDRDNASFYASNANNLKSRLYALDTEYKRGLSDCRTKSIVTSHAAFAYLAKAYGLRQVAIAGLSTETEPSPRDLAEVAKFARENNVKYIFFETLVSPKLAETIANEVGAETLVLNPLEGLTSDEIKDGADYFTVMQENLANLRIALECR